MSGLGIRICLTILLLLSAALGCYLLWWLYPKPTGTVTVDFDPPAEAVPITVSLDDFTFTERSGETFPLSRLQGKVWVASFFFASCPGFCLQMNMAIAKLQKELADTDVKFVSITVDPQNDTPQRLAQYADGFQADAEKWLFLTGSFDDARHLGEQQLKVTVLPKDHSDRLVLVDRQGTVRGWYSSLKEAELIAFRRKVRQVLDEPFSTPPADAHKPAGARSPTPEPAEATRQPVEEIP